MADHMNDGEQPRGNRPADNAKQATPGSLAFQKGWQGNALAGDFLGLNDVDAPAPEPVAPAPAPVARPQPAPSAPALGDGESWLLSSEEPASNAIAPRTIAHVAPAATHAAMPPSHEPLETPQEEEAACDESASVDDGAREATETIGAGYRAPNVLDASWTEPAAPRRVPKRPVLVAACVVGVLAIGGYVAFVPKDAARELESVASVDTTPSTPGHGDSNAGKQDTGPVVLPAPQPGVGEPSPGVEPSTSAEEPEREPELEGVEASAAGEPLDAPDASLGRVALDVHGQAQPMPAPEMASEAGESVAVAPPPEENPMVETLALAEPPSAPILAGETRVSAEQGAPLGNLPGNSPESSPEGPAGNAAGLGTGNSAPSGPDAAAPALPAVTTPEPVPEIARPRFVAPEPPTSEKPAQEKVVPEGPALPPTSPSVPAGAPTLPAAGVSGPPAANAKPAAPAAGASTPVAAPELAAAAPQAPAPAAGTPNAQPGANSGANPEPVKVLGSQSTTLADAAKDRPTEDAHPSAVPSVPPVPPAKPADGQAVATVPATPASGTPPGEKPGAPIGPEPAHETREVALPPKDVILPSISVEGVRAAQGKDLDGVWSSDTIPMDRIANPTKILTPSVGDVRVTLKSKDVFEGRLYAVGQNSVWIEGPFGRLGLTHDRIASVDKVGAPAPAAAPNSGGVQKFGRVRVKTGGGTLLGTVTSIDGDKMKVVTDSGLKLTVDAKDVEPYVEEPKIVIKQPAKQG